MLWQKYQIRRRKKIIWEKIIDLHKALELPPLTEISPFPYQLNSKWFMVINGKNKIIKFKNIEIKPYHVFFWYNGTLSLSLSCQDSTISFLQEREKEDGKVTKDLKKAFNQSILREEKNSVKRIRKRFR